ncbi:hypothetical protein Tco_1063319 [Tanacetum coccineum]
MSKLLKDVQNISEELSEYINCPSWTRPTFYDDDDDEYTIIYRKPKAITPDLPIDKYGYIKNHKKTVKNGQTRTREMEEHKRSQRFKAKAKESQLSVSYSDSFFEESDTSFSHLDNSLPEFETFSDHTEETRSGSTTTHANNSLPEYDSFLFEVEPDQGGLTSVVISDNSNDPLLEFPEFESFHFNLFMIIILNEDKCFNPGGGKINVEDDDSFTFVIWTFLPFLTYHVDSPLLLSTGSEDTIFDLGYPDFEDSRAHGFVHSFELHILSFI